MQVSSLPEIRKRFAAGIGLTEIKNEWGEVRNILCIRLDSLGDVLMTTPAIRAIKVTVPNCKVTLLTSPEGAKGAELVPEIDDVIAYESPWMKSTGSRKTSRPEFELVSCLSQRKFDAAIIFTVYSQNPLPAALLAHLAGIPLRLAHCRENPYQLLTHWIPESEPQNGIRHEVRRQLDLVATVGFHTEDERLSLKIPAQAERSLVDILDKLKIDLQEPWLVMHPGASAPSRRYRPEGFAKIARTLMLGFRFRTLFTGVHQEKQLVESIQEMMDVPSDNLAGKLDLAEFAALLKAAPVLISNNTGPVHIAAALGTPLVDLYALTNPQHTPWQVPHRVLNHDVPCKFCYKSICPEKHHRCLSMVSVHEVIRAALELLGNPEPTGSIFSRSHHD